MNQIKMKLILSLSGILLGLTMIAGASYAWFSISVKPEVRSLTIQMTPMNDQRPFDLSIDYGEKGADATWTNELILENYFAEDTANKKDYGFLRPISTADGEHWYLPVYDSKGDVSGFREVPLAQVANQMYSTDEAGSEDHSNYLMYVDFWVRNRQGSNYDLLLNNPNSVAGSEQYYGSYVLWTPEEDSTGKWIKSGSGSSTKLQGNDAMASTRVGFTMLQDINKNGTATNCTEDFFIYEPNGDMRSQALVDYLKSTTIKENGKSPSEMGTLKYIYSGSSNITVAGYESTYLTNKDKFFTTMVPRKTANGWELVDIKSVLGNRIVSQKTSSWNEEKLAAMENDTRITSKALDLNGIGALGVTGAADAAGVTAWSATTTANRTEITSINGGEIKKIRMFIWLEGQDIDCWNQIADGNIFVNLEFFGRASS